MRLFFLLAACVRTPVPPAGAVSEAPAVAPAEPIAPRPFTMEQLRDGIPRGTVIRLRVETAGQPTVEQEWTFTAVDAASATIASKVFGADGSLVKDEGEGTSTWAELNEHASFPAARTTRVESAVEGPLGHVETWLYTVADTDEGGVPVTKRYQFAKTLPGPPVLFTIEREGVEVFRMTMVARR
jgi:hypothetical protein